MFSIIFSKGHKSENSTYAPAIGINTEMIKIQMANTVPNVFTTPSDLFDENKTKYPTTNQKVAGNKLKKKHIYDLR